MRKESRGLAHLIARKPPRWGVYFLPLKPVPEFAFHPDRKWRFDLAWPAERIAVEINGGLFVQGRHTRGAGQLRDMEKLNHAQLLGWRVFQFTPDQVKSGEAREFVELAMRPTVPPSPPRCPDR